jgi:hypothetical protein
VPSSDRFFDALFWESFPQQWWLAYAAVPERFGSSRGRANRHRGFDSVRGKGILREITVFLPVLGQNWLRNYWGFGEKMISATGRWLMLFGVVVSLAACSGGSVSIGIDGLGAVDSEEIAQADSGADVVQRIDVEDVPSVPDEVSYPETLEV